MVKVNVWHNINYMAEAIALLERCADSDDVFQNSAAAAFG